MKYQCLNVVTFYIPNQNHEKFSTQKLLNLWVLNLQTHSNQSFQLEAAFNASFIHLPDIDQAYYLELSILSKGYIVTEGFFKYGGRSNASILL